jgi:hypothetical protein
MGSPEVLIPVGGIHNGPFDDFMRQEMYGAIKVRYEAMGGEAFLGPIDRQEDGAWYFQRGSALVYRVPAAVFEVHGAIYHKWIELGGLTYGVPSTDEMTTPDGVGRYNHFGKSASIYWTLDTGAFEVHGDIHKRWAKLGWETGLGYPISDELTAPDGIGRYNHFSKSASIYWTPETKAFEVMGAIRDKWASLGWETGLGYPTTGEKPTLDGIGRYNHFSKSASIHWSPSTGAFAVQGAIRDHWSGLGWETGLGYPVSDELTTADTVGRYNHFSKSASIYWTPATGAIDVQGAIRDKWAALGWEQSYLGYPTRGEEDFSEAGRASSFQHGEIYWWPEAGAIDLKGVVFSFKGFHCFGETDNVDELSGSDEPYFLFTVVAAGVRTASRTPITENVDAGGSFPREIELYRGPPYGMILDATLMEHDAGDPDRYRSDIEAALMAHHDIGVFALEHIPGVGPAISKIVDITLGPLMPSLAEAISDALGFGDNRIGSSNFVLTGKQMVLLAARTADKSFKSLIFKIETGLISGDGASYKGYFTLSPA